MVPIGIYGKDRRVRALMIEVNRRLYMNEETGERSGGFDSVRAMLRRALSRIAASVA